MALNSDFQKLDVDGLITLFELDAQALGAGILRFHGHISFVEWQKIYTSMGSEDGYMGDEEQFIGAEILKCLGKFARSRPWDRLPGRNQR